MLLRLSYILCLQIITINYPTSYATNTVDTVNKGDEIYSNRTINGNYAKTPVSINEKINVYILPEPQNVREDKSKVVLRDLEENEPVMFKSRRSRSTLEFPGVEWFGNSVEKVIQSPKTRHRKMVASFDKKVSSQDSSLNIVADFLIDMVRQQIVKHGQDDMKIPDIHDKFHKGIGSFDAVDGWFRSLTSLQRTTNVTVSRTGDVLSVEVGMGLASMVLGYDHYSAKYLRIGPRGNIKGEVDQNSLVVQLTVDITNGDCKLAIRKLYFKEFSKLKIYVTGLGKLNWVYSKIVTWITNMFREEIIHSAENILKENMESSLSRFNCS